MRYSKQIVFVIVAVTALASAVSVSAAKTPWWNQSKIRFFWGQWSHILDAQQGNESPDAVMSALAKIGATVYVNDAPAPVPDQLKLAAIAKKHGIRFFGTRYVANLVEFSSKLKAPLAVDAQGNTSENLPDPFFKPAYEEWFLKPAMEMAKSGLVDGMHVDWEFYGGNGEGRDVYNDEYFNAWLKTKGITESVPVKERYAWLIQKGLRNDYLGYLRDLTKAMFAEFAAKVRKIKPDFVFSSYDGFFGDNLEGGGWRVSGISAGLNSPNAPYFVIDPRHYWDYNASPWWDSFYSYHHNLGFKHIGGTWDNRFSGGQPATQVSLTQWMYDMSMNTDGYWLWFEREFGESDWQNMAAGNRRIKVVEENVGPFMLQGKQDGNFVTVVEWSGNPELDRKVKQRAYHLGNEHLVRVCDVDSYRPLQVRLRFPNLPEKSRWTVRDPISGLYYSYDGKTAVWDAKQLLEGLVIPLEKRSDQFLLLSPARGGARVPRSKLLANQIGIPVRQGIYTSASPDPVAGDPSAATRLLFTKTYAMGNWGAQGGWVIGSGIASGDLAAKNAQRLRNSSGNFWSPSWSPDRKKILFVQNVPGRRQVCTMSADGTGVADLSNNQFCDKSPVWSPDGSKVAFVSDRDGNWEIYVMNADGSGVKRLTNSPGTDSAPCWSPDGKKIAFETNRGINTCVFTMNADGSDQKPIINLAGDIIEPAWSPDGKLIAATCLTSYQRGLVVANVETGRLIIPTQPYLQVESPRWSPDSRRIAAIFYNNQERDNAGITIFDLAAKGDKVTTEGIIGPAGQVEEILCKSLVDVGGIRPHPGGGREGFPSWYSFGSQAPAWIVKMFYGLSWSPDGKQVSFSSDMDQSGSFRVYTVPAITMRNNDRVGFYLYRIGSIDNVVVYTKADNGGWKEAFRDDFERKELGKDWKIVEGQFSIEAGKLKGNGIIMCTRAFPGSERMEYEAMAPAGGPAGDLSAFISSTAEDPWEGALFAFGSFDNTFSKIQIRGKEVSHVGARIVPGKVHKILCERDGANMRQVIDGVETQKYTDLLAAWVTNAQTSGDPVALPDSTSAWPQETAWGFR